MSVGYNEQPWQTHRTEWTYRATTPVCSLTYFSSLRWRGLKSTTMLQTVLPTTAQDSLASSCGGRLMPVLSGFNQQVSTKAFRQQSEVITIFTVLLIGIIVRFSQGLQRRKTTQQLLLVYKEQKKNVLYINTMEYYSAIKKTKWCHLQENR